jgi:hypothetical protein
MIQSVLLGVHLAAFFDLVAPACDADGARRRFLTSRSCLPRLAHPIAPLLFLL